MREGEEVIFEIRRHPVGIIGVYISFGVLLAFVGFGAVIAPSMFTDYDKRFISNIGLGVFLACIALSAVFVYIARIVYYGNRWILTSDSLTQVNQHSLFSKQSSQLGMDNLEDVTVEQNGIIAHMFNYGTLRGQTAGEHGKFMITYCPRPTEYAQKMLIARENFEHGEQHVPTQTGSNAPR